MSQRSPGCKTLRCFKKNPIVAKICDANMIIVFFHVIYLIGKMVYENYRCSRLRDTIEIKDVEEEPSRAPVIAKAANDQVGRKYYDPLDASYDDEDRPRAPKFSPPAYIQRYLAVIKVLSDPRYHGTIKKVVDYGCSELGFVTYLKHTPGIEEILCVDIDRNTLERHKDKAIPLNADYLRKRQHPLTIRVYEGSVTDCDRVLINSDAVVAIELIEHLYPDALMDFPYNVFGFVRPLVAIVTTPNADFNVLFPDMKSQFRHWDHKFEWTRQQFEDWSRNIVSRYPEYEVTFEGVCAGPSGTEKYGCCSQMAVFRRTREAPLAAVVYGREGLLKNVTTEEYPYRVDNRSDEEKILDEASYHIRQYAHNNPEGSEEYPLASLMRNLANFHVTPAGLREILVNGNWTIVDREDGPIIQCPEPSTFSDYELEVDALEEGLDDEWMDRIPAHLPNAWGGLRETHVESAYDDECWDDDYDLTVPVESSIDNSMDELAVDLRIPPVVFSLTRSLDTADTDCIVIANASDVPSSLEDDRTSAFVSDPDENSFLARNTSKSPSSRITRLDENSRGNGELGSLCSIYLESSRNDEADTCPRDITNSSFDCTELQRSFEDEKRRDEKFPELGRRFVAGVDHLEEPRSSSSPRASLERRESADQSFNLDTSRRADSGNAVHSPEVNETHENDEELGAGENKWQDATILGDVVVRDDEEAVRRVACSERQKTPVSLRLRGALCSSDVSRTITCHQAAPSITDDLGASRNCDEAAKNPHAEIIPDEESFIEVTFAKDTKDSRRNGRKEETAPSPETPPGSWSPEIMDSGYPNTSSIQDTTPEYDLSSIAQDRISDSESPSVAEVPHVFLEPPLVVDEVENGDLANNNRDGEGNNVAADHYEPDDLQPLIDVLEHDLENENDIYVLENDFPVWLLRILERGRPRPPRRALAERDERLLAVRLNVNAPGGQRGIAEPNVDDEGLTSSESDEEFDDNDDADRDDDDDDDNDDDDEDNANGDGEDEDENVESGDDDITDWNMSGYQC